MTKLALVENVAQEKDDRAERRLREECLRMAASLGEADGVEELLARAERLYAWLRGSGAR